jgi:hypothetical protein
MTMYYEIGCNLIDFLSENHPDLLVAMLGNDEDATG